MKISTRIFALLIAHIVFLTSCKQKDTINTSKENSGIKGHVVLSDTLNEASCVYLTENEDGIPVISWVEIDSVRTKHFYFANWNNQKNEFDPHKNIPIEQNASIHEEGMPKLIYKGDGTLMAVYEVSTPKEGSMWGIGDILYIQSFDKGESWTDPASIFKDSIKDLSYSFGNLCRLSDGEIGASCLGTSPDSTVIGRPVLFAKTSGNEGFGKSIQVENEACQCCRTAISSDINGKITIAYRDLEPGNIRDIAISTSNDGGNTFTQPDIFSNDMWSVNGCPHNGPSVKLNNNKTYIAWFTGGNEVGLHYAELDRFGKEIEHKFLSKDGNFIQLILLPNGTRVTAYNASYEVNDSIFSKIMVNKISDDGFFQKEISSSHEQASYPVLHAIDTTKIIVAWKRNNDKVCYQMINVDQVKQTAIEAEMTHQVSIETLNVKPDELVSQIDPVCGMFLDEKILGDTMLYKNDIYGFCSGHCKNLFIDTPQKYIPKALE